MSEFSAVTTAKDESSSAMMDDLERRFEAAWLETWADDDKGAFEDLAAKQKTKEQVYADTTRCRTIGGLKRAISGAKKASRRVTFDATLCFIE